MDAKRSRKALLLIAALLSLSLVIATHLEPQKKHQGGEIIRCTGTERNALLKFKAGLIDNYGYISTWGLTEECCDWLCVECSNATGGHSAASYHVVSLHMSNINIGGVINPALLELPHLKDLDLSSNYFAGTRVPEFIGSIKHLQHLNLGNSDFSGVIPPQLGNITNLQTLDLSLNYFTGIIPPQLGNLTNLHTLNLSSNSFAGIIPPQLWNLTNIQTLDLYFNSFTEIIPPQIGNLTKLHTIDISHNSFAGIIPPQLGNLSNVYTLGLSSNSFSGVIPPQLGNLTNLHRLDLSSNYLWSENLNWLSNLSHLIYLDLSSSSLSYTNWLQPILMLHSLQELRLLSCSLEDVYALRLVNNNLTSSAFDWLFNISTSLKVLDLSDNKLEGPIPDMRACPSLREVNFAGNRLIGALPSSLGRLSKLQVLDLSFNSLEGTVSEANLRNFLELTFLDLSFNSLTMQIAPDWTPPFQLQILKLARCNMGQHFPYWIRTQQNLEALDVSDAGLSCEVPHWMWNFSSTLGFLNISFNHINGTIPDLSTPFLYGIDVRSNKLSGPIPSFPLMTTFIMLSQNMFSGPISSSICSSFSSSAFFSKSNLLFLDLSNNLLVGELPNCWDQLPDLQYLNLANNTFSGEIPYSLGTLSDLRALHLRGNNLSGHLPPTLRSSQQLRLIDIGGNKLTGDISWIANANYPQVNYLMLGDNRFYGSIPPQICQCTRLQILDLSRNNFSGIIPHCLNNFTAMCGNYTYEPFVGVVYADLFHGSNYPRSKSINIDKLFVQWKGQVQEYTKTLRLVKLIDLSSNRLVGNIPTSFSHLKALNSLNLSRNSLRGNIMRGIGEMESLETLDLSTNQLSGEIPIGLAQLHYLSVLDLANNNLTGQIPSSTQLQGFNGSAYAGNDGLCGLPLPLCLKPFNNTKPEEKFDKKGSGFSLSSRQEMFISVFMGFFVGFWGVVASLVLKRSWRSAYFNLLNVVGDWVLVKSTLFLAKFSRR